MTPAVLSETEFHQMADAFLLSLEEAFDAAEIDWERTPGGVMQLDFDDGSQIIINKQAPLREIWIAARAGGFHFFYRDGRWLDTRRGDELVDALTGYVSQQAGRRVVL